MLQYYLFIYINAPLFLFFRPRWASRKVKDWGKYSQGRKDIVEASNQKGRRGLGLTLQGFDQELNVDWRAEPEVTAVERRPESCGCVTLHSRVSKLVPRGSVIRVISGD